MSQDFQDPEIFADFIIEAKEHLETIEPNLLELEKAPDNLSLLNDIFRPMHSMKGASGFMGLNKINHLAHKSENILDELRKGTMLVTSEIMDVILAATDALRQMIDNLNTTGVEGEVETAEIVEQIDAIMRGEVAPPPVIASEPNSQPAPEDKPSSDDNSFAIEALSDEDKFMHELGQVIEDASHEAKRDEAEQPDMAFFAVNPDSSEVDSISSSEWIESLEHLPSYALTAFGEGHLKDFMDEARENIENLSTGLLELEQSSKDNSELINDLFRYFHNIKGNSGIIGYQELNSLTHEAETLLNRVRHGEMEISHELIDQLLLVVDVMESLVEGIEPSTGLAFPIDASELVGLLQQVVSGGTIDLPKGLERGKTGEGDEAIAEPVVITTPPITTPAMARVATDATATTVATSSGLVAAGANRDAEDIEVFSTTVRQQMEVAKVAFVEIGKDASQTSYHDALFRSLVAIQKSASFMGFEDIKVYAERTSGLVDQARKSGLDFSLMTDILSQEFGIIDDMVQKAVSLAGVFASEDKEEVAPQVAQVQESKPKETAKSSQTPMDHLADSLVPPPTAITKSEVQKTVADKQAAQEAPKTPVAQATPPTSVAKASSTPIASPNSTSASPTSSSPASASPTSTSPTSTSPASANSKAAPAQHTEATKSTIRVDHEKLDHLMNLIGELIINRNRYTMIARRLEDDSSNVALIAQDLSETTYGMARISDDLQDTIMKVRMVPVSSVFSRFPRLVRDLSRKSNKEVELILEGEETELDKSVVEVIGDPLTHLIRNSVDHGIESEADRIALGKNPKGRVVLRAYHKGNSVAIEIEDDGKGIDPDKMRESAVRKGLLTAEEAKNMDDRDAIDLIFAPGFSTAAQVTDISGRGVGMDVVRTNIKNLKGSVSTFSEIGKGTRFTLLLPLTLAIIDVLMVVVNNQSYAIPLDSVSETTKLETAHLTDIKGRKAVTLRGEVLGIVSLAEMLGLPYEEELPEMLPVVVIHDNERRLGLVVDRLLERQEIVIKPLGTYLGDLKGISGATIMGDGSVILILDPHEMYSMATSKVNKVQDA